MEDEGVCTFITDGVAEVISASLLALALDVGQNVGGEVGQLLRSVPRPCRFQVPTVWWSWTVTSG